MNHRTASTRAASTLGLALAASLLAAVPAAAPARGPLVVEGAIWANGALYDTVITPATFKAPPSHSVDLIYTFDMSGLQGQRSVSESAPGDADYSGGRWSVQMVVFTDDGKAFHDPDGDGVVNFELTTEEQILQEKEDGLLDIFDADFYFECPLLPRS